MRSSFLLLALAAIPVLASAAPIVTVASDNFDSYATGALNGANGGTGFTGAWSGALGATIVDAATSDAPMDGKALQFTRPDNPGAATRTLNRSLSDDVLVSFQFQFNSGAIGNNDFLALWFGDASGPNIGLKANCGDGSCTADLFARTVLGDAAYKQNIRIGQTYSLLGYLQKTGNSSVYNKFSLWVDQDMVSSTLDLNTAAAVFDVGASNVSSFSTIGFRTASLDGLPQTDSLLIDNLRIAVVPAPGTLALAGLALLGLFAVRRRG